MALTKSEKLEKIKEIFADFDYLFDSKNPEDNIKIMVNNSIGEPPLKEDEFFIWCSLTCEKVRIKVNYEAGLFLYRGDWAIPKEFLYQYFVSFPIGWLHRAINVSEQRLAIYIVNKGLKTIMEHKRLTDKLEGEIYE